MQGKQPAVYMLSNQRNGTLYTGVTSNLIKRLWQHKNDLVDGFSKKYSTHSLVWYELHQDILIAIQREKAIKKWQCGWKLKLIENVNPEWKDLFEDLL